MKKCTHCLIEKSLSDFSICKRESDGLQDHCKECNSKYYQERREAILARVLKHKLTNLEKVRTLNRKSSAEFRNKNTGRRTAWVAKRRLKEVMATPQWADLSKIEDLYTISSIYRKAGIDCSIDHIVPLQSKLVCGLHCEQNLTLISLKENIVKSNTVWQYK